MVGQARNIRMEYATIDQLLYVHRTRRVDDIFAHLGLVCAKRPIVEHYPRSTEGFSEGRWVKEICNRGGDIWMGHEVCPKLRSGIISMRYQADGWRPRK
jgi:hypothetical protein